MSARYRPIDNHHAAHPEPTSFKILSKSKEGSGERELTKDDATEHLSNVSRQTDCCYFISIYIYSQQT